MKTQVLPLAFLRTACLFLFLLCIVPSCSVFHFNKVNPYNDYTTDQLSKYQVEKIHLFVPDNLVVYPGSTFQIGIIAEARFHKQLKTRGLADGFVNWTSYVVNVEGGTFDNGTITIFSDPRKVSDSIRISVSPYINMSMKQEITLPVSYKVKFVADCKGQNGQNGIDGLSGAELHQMDTTEKHHIYNGRKGQSGTEGMNGADGCLADVFVKSMTLSGKKMMNVLVINHCDNSHSVFWVDPDGGSLVVDVSGGDGGNGGKGGDGENGVDGAGADPHASPNYTPPQPITIPDPTKPAPPTSPDYYGSTATMNYIDLTVDSTKNPTGNGGNGGFGGNGGNAGNGGNGGLAVIHLDSSAIGWENKIVVNCNGGKSGTGGAGGYAGRGGRAAYNMYSKKDGITGYMGAQGIKARAGENGSPAILKKEKVLLSW
jgi:hypothetical protein